MSATVKIYYSGSWVNINTTTVKVKNNDGSGLGLNIDSNIINVYSGNSVNISGSIYESWIEVNPISKLKVWYSSSWNQTQV